jgi:hypothetical protein
MPQDPTTGDQGNHWGSETPGPGGIPSYTRPDGSQALGSFGATQFLGVTPGPMDPEDYANWQMSQVNYPTDIANSQAWTQMMQQGANASEMRNPYEANVANRSFAGQDNAQQGLMAALAGPSVTNLQAQLGQQQNLQSAARAQAGGRGRAVGMQLAQNAGAMANQQGQGALRENMAGRQVASQGAQAMRGQALQVMQDQSQSGLQARSLSDQQRQFYAQQGARLALAQRQSAIERYKLFKQLQMRRQQQYGTMIQNATNISAAATSAAMGFGG